MPLYDLDARKGKTSLVELMKFDLPFSGIMPDEFEYNDTDVRFVYSDLGISAQKLEQLMKLKVRYNGIDRHFAFVTIAIHYGDDYEYDPAYDDEVRTSTKHTVAVFE